MAPFVHNVVRAMEHSPEGFCLALAHSLAKNGYCVIEGQQDEWRHAAAMGEVEELDASGKFARTPAEIVDGLLGADGSLRIAQVDTIRDENVTEDQMSTLQLLDLHLGAYCAALEENSMHLLGFNMHTRSQGLIHEAGTSASVGPPMPLDAQTALQWLDRFQWRRVIALHFLGPSSGMLEMRPFDLDSGSHSLPVEPGMWVLVRADMLSHSFLPKGKSYVLSSFVMQTRSNPSHQDIPVNLRKSPCAQNLEEELVKLMGQLKELSADDILSSGVGRSVQLSTNHMYRKGLQVAVRGHACRFPAMSDPDLFWPLLSTGSDLSLTIPPTRWNHADYYVSGGPDEAAKDHKAYCEHGTFIEGIELFDCKFFGVPPAEAKVMDPCQRHMLEVGYMTFFDAGLRRPQLSRMFCGVYTGAGWPDFTMVEQEGGGVFGGTTASVAITSNRMSYVMGITGPSFSLDTEGSAALMAINIGACSLQQGRQTENSSCLCMGVDFIISPIPFTRACWSGLLSTRGRCLAFDSTADGYIRGDGIGGVYLDPLLIDLDGGKVMDEKRECKAIIEGAHASNSGRTAGMGAPSGPMDQALIAECVRKAGISPLDVDFVECWGSGTLMGDAVESTSAAIALRCRDNKLTQEMLAMGTVKTNMGNSVNAAGMVSFIKAVISMKHGSMPPTSHLRKLNPYVDMDSMPSFFATESVRHRMRSAFVGITAKGWGGSNCHVIAWNSHKKPQSEEERQPPQMQRQIAYWPGGGGDLESEEIPNKGYFIAGSWSSWKAEPMQKDGGGFSFTVTLGENIYERFQIWLDGDSKRVLHPDAPCVSRACGVLGPSDFSDCDTELGRSLCWCINGRTIVDPRADRPEKTRNAGDKALTGKDASAEEKKGVYWHGEDSSLVGHQFRVELAITGKYRMVTWHKVLAADGTPTIGTVPVGTYQISASWGNWELDEMAPDSSEVGTFHRDIRLPSGGGDFQIVRNRDCTQVFYPWTPHAPSAEDCNPMCPNEHGSGMYWFVSGNAGDMFRITFHRSVAKGSSNNAPEKLSGVLMDKVSWEKL